VVSAATSGQEPDGTVDEWGGTIETAAERPGTIRVDVFVHTTPESAATGRGLDRRANPAAIDRVEVRSMHVAGLGPTALARIRESDRPLASVPMQRVFTVRALGAGARLHDVGSFDVGPDGRLDVHDHAIAALAQLGQAIPIGAETIGAAAAGANRDAADAAARAILHGSDATMSTLRGP
jgi:hypothetical protein